MDIRERAEQAAREYMDAYAATPGCGVDASQFLRPSDGDYTVVSDSPGKVGPQSPVEYADPGPASMGTFGGGR
jgi:hypothetical protein